ncbi:MAG: heavy metal translocating P-type ATPase [Candidatus Avoscillospira sp.]
MKQLEQFLARGGVRKDVVCLVLSGLALLVSLLDRLPLPFDAAWIAIVLCGVPIILEAVHGLVTAFDIKADVLVSLALVASVAIGETFAAGEVAFIMQLGGLLEELTVARARAGIEKLVRLTPRTARVLRDGQEVAIPAEKVRVGETVRVLPGETVPADGVVTAGRTSIDQAVMTGESLPVDKGPGDEVSSGTVNQFGSFAMEVTRAGEDSAIQRMIRLVQSADAGKAKIVGLADRWATWIVVIALTAAALAWLISGQLIRAVTILVVFCPCSLVLATPTAIMAAIGNASRHGFLVREGDALERLASVAQAAFDKTGTLTCGTPQVVAVCPLDPAVSREELAAWTAAAEGRSEHPLGKAIVRCCGEPALPVSDFQMLPGRGVRAVVSGREILAGNPTLLEAHGVAAEDLARAAAAWVDRGCTITYVAVGGVPTGFLALSDTLRPEAAATVAAIGETGVTPVLLTGDHRQAACTIARQLAISEVRAQCRPEDKLQYIREVQEKGRPVCMVGDGVNDAPALKTARVGIAMGGMGSDIAVDAADIVLVGGDLRELPHLLRLSRRMMKTIRWNLSFSMLLNFVAIVLAMTGILNPVVGALVHNAGSVFVMIHSAFLLTWKPRNP